MSAKKSPGFQSKQLKKDTIEFILNFLERRSYKQIDRDFLKKILNKLPDKDMAKLTNYYQILKRSAKFHKSIDIPDKLSSEILAIISRVKLLEQAINTSINFLCILLVGDDYNKENIPIDKVYLKNSLNDLSQRKKDVLIQYYEFQMKQRSEGISSKMSPELKEEYDSIIANFFSLESLYEYYGDVKETIDGIYRKLERVEGLTKFDAIRYYVAYLIFFSTGREMIYDGDSSKKYDEDHESFKDWEVLKSSYEHFLKDRPDAIVKLSNIIILMEMFSIDQQNAIRKFVGLPVIKKPEPAINIREYIKPQPELQQDSEPTQQSDDIIYYSQIRQLKQEMFNEGETFSILSNYIMGAFDKPYMGKKTGDARLPIYKTKPKDSFEDKVLKMFLNEELREAQDKKAALEKMNKKVKAIMQALQIYGR